MVVRQIDVGLLQWGINLREISRITRLAYNTIVSIVCSASIDAQVHNHKVEQVQAEEVSGNGIGAFVQTSSNSP